MEFGEMVKQARETRFRSAKEFFRDAQLPCSYFYYSSVEKGTVPSLDLAMQIVKSLDINQRRGLYAWARSQMPDDVSKSYFTELDDADTKSGAEDLTAEKTLIVNRMQAKMLQDHPLIMEVLMVINWRGRNEKIDLTCLAKRFSLSTQEMEKILSNLYDYGLVEKDEGGYYSREWIYIPYDKDFEPLRISTFRRAVDQFFAQTEEPKIRAAVTAFLSEEQMQLVETKAVNFINWVVSLQEEPATVIKKPVTIGIFGSKRKFGDQQASFDGG